MKIAFLRAREGFALIPFLIFMVLCSAIVIASLNVSSSTTRTTHATTMRSKRYYQAESALHTALAWMRKNSQSLVSPFTAANFYNTFERTSPSIGTNDTVVKVPTKLKLKSSNTQSVVLRSASALGASNFPNTTHMVTSAAFQPATSYPSAGFGDTLVQVTLIDAFPIDPTKDAPPLAAAETDFYPIYRIDAMTGTDRGSHLYGYVTGNLYYIDVIGFYGRESVEVNQDCKSSYFTTPNPGAYNAKCPVGSNGPITLANNAEIYGSARSNTSVTPVSHVCSDLACVKKGENYCAGTSCAVPDIPADLGVPACPPGGGPNISTKNDRRDEIPLSGGCYGAVSVTNKKKIVLWDVKNKYYFESLSIDGGNPGTQIYIDPKDEHGNKSNLPVLLYVKNLPSGNINGNETVNSAAKPSQFYFYYLGAAPIKLNGNAEFRMKLTAPNADIEMTGTADYYGGCLAKKLKFQGSTKIVYDEALGGTSLNDFTSRLRSIEEAYN